LTPDLIVDIDQMIISGKSVRLAEKLHLIDFQAQ